MSEASPELSAYEIYTTIVDRNDGASSGQIAARLREEAEEIRAEAHVQNELLTTRFDVSQNFPLDQVEQADTGNADEEAETIETKAKLLERSAYGLDTAFDGPTEMKNLGEGVAGQAQLGGSKIWADPRSISVEATGEQPSERYGFVSYTMANGLDAHERGHRKQSGKINPALSWSVDTFHNGDATDLYELGAGFDQKEEEQASLKLLSKEYQSRIISVPFGAEDRDAVQGNTEDAVRLVYRKKGEVDTGGAPQEIVDAVEKVKGEEDLIEMNHLAL